jgi:hypothetical protein
MVEKERPNQIMQLMCHDQGDKINIDKMLKKMIFKIEYIGWMKDK